jgi:hypothetical protein
MKRIENKLAATFLGMTLACNACTVAIAQQQAPAATAAKATVEEEPSLPTKPGTEGIKVHGHWLIDLKDKDGKVLEHRDFHNSLNISGADILAKLISGQSVMGSLQILAGGFFIYRPDIANHGLNSCNSTPPNAACVPNLTISYTHFDIPNNIPNSLVTLSGSITPTAAIVVSTVSTASVACALSQQPATPTLLTESPARCAALDFDAGVTSQDNFFTGTNITPINVAAGQTLAITVVLSFS